MHAFKSLLISAVISMSPGFAVAQALITLTCDGELHDYEQGNIVARATGATTIDLSRNLLTTPAGIFRILGVSDAKYYIEQADALRRVWGSLDRYTGRLAVMWNRHGEVRQLSYLLELQCYAAQRLF